MQKYYFFFFYKHLRTRHEIAFSRIVFGKWLDGINEIDTGFYDGFIIYGMDNISISPANFR